VIGKPGFKRAARDVLQQLDVIAQDAAKAIPALRRYGRNKMGRRTAIQPAIQRL
jgi:hypothetical protein